MCQWDIKIRKNNTKTEIEINKGKQLSEFK